MNSRDWRTALSGVLAIDEKTGVSSAIASVPPAADAPPAWPLYVYRTHRTPVPARVKLVYDELARTLKAWVATTTLDGGQQKV